MSEWILGRNPVYETLQARRRQTLRLLVAQGAQEKGRLAEVINLCRNRGLAVEQTPRQRLDALGAGHQGVALQAGPYPYADLQDMLELAAQRQEPPFLLVLDALQDPQNFGTLLRTAEAVGVHGVLLPLRHTVTVTTAVVSASSGASEHLLVAQTNLAQVIEALKKAGLWVVGLDSGAEAQSIARVRLDGALALVVGSEGEGMRALVRDSCDILASLPMRGRVESLNAAVAGSVALYLAWQARGFGEFSRKGIDD
jgi:23S rRNA (guanosine2251-2'-O)-methyltransferase